jgi:hypothetical protein
MEELNNLMHGFSVALTLPNIGFMVLGITLGILIGVLPGLGGANGIAILLAAYLHDGPDVGDHHAVLHLLGRVVRWGDHVDPVQHSG